MRFLYKEKGTRMPRAGIVQKLPKKMSENEEEPALSSIQMEMSSLVEMQLQMQRKLDAMVGSFDSKVENEEMAKEEEKVEKKRKLQAMVGSIEAGKDGKEEKEKEVKFSKKSSGKEKEINSKTESFSKPCVCTKKSFRCQSRCLEKEYARNRRQKSDLGSETQNQKWG